jgi:DNA-binding beta-propeller fold protein YncE
MQAIFIFFRRTIAAAAIACLFTCVLPAHGQPVKKLLYVAEPGIRNYLEYGGHGILVYDIEKNFTLVKRIPTVSYDSSGHPSNVKGVCVSLATQCIYVSTVKSLQCISLQSEKILWEKTYSKGCDRMAISNDGLTIFQPSFENDQWYVIDARTGKLQQEIVLASKAHNTIVGLTGNTVYMEGLASPLLTVLNASQPATKRTVGPFTDMIRPFTINGKQTRVFANVNGLLGFEVGDLRTGKMLYRVEVKGYQQGMIKRHGCPSHGIGLTPNEKELWVADGANQAVHVFDASRMPPVQVNSIALRDQPGWITFSLDGKYAFPSTGEIIEIATKKIIKSLADENGGIVQSEKMIEVHFKNGKAIAKGDQFGLGRVLK